MMQNNDNMPCYAKLSVCNLAMAIGVVSGLMTFILALVAMFSNYGMPIVEFYGNLYIGYEASFVGAFIGLIWSFIVGYITGALLAWVYNCCHRYCKCKCCTASRECCKKMAE